ncbi:MAG TPA: NF038143 family protein [Desulfotignum sp.]|nr:NF038143 family protein [Desulfotignum sp.]
MSKILDKRYSELLEQEKRFIKRVVYFIHAYTPRPWWRVVIPFNFLIDYFSRKKEIQAFSDSHFYLKQIALSMAYKDAESGNPGQSNSEMQAELRDYWMHMQKIESRELYEHLQQWMAMLKKHYLKLLLVQERYYIPLLQKAYSSRQEYKAFLTELTKLEEKIDQIILEYQNDKVLPAGYIQRKQKAFQEIRERDLREAFGEE